MASQTAANWRGSGTVLDLILEELYRSLSHSCLPGRAWFDVVQAPKK